jgi:hypothetical protein
MNALVSTVVDEPMDFTVIANSPAEMESSQRSLIQWAERKMQSLKGQLDVADHQRKIAQQRELFT